MNKKIIGVTVGTTTSPKLLEKTLKPVKTVNGVEPDENGNVLVGGSGESAADVQTNLDAHTANNTNPHGVTAAQVGAAPDGFGLGTDSYIKSRTSCTTKEQVDAIDGNGFFAYCNTSDPLVAGEADTSYVYGIQSQYSLRHLKQNAVCVYNGDVVERIKVDGAWRNWEYTRPMCYVGKEYRLSERYVGKAVYTKLINCGQVASGLKTVTISLGATNLIRYSAQYCGDDGKLRLIPWLDPASYPTHFIDIGVQGTNVYINAGTAYGNTDIGTLYLQVWYTKF